MIIMLMKIRTEYYLLVFMLVILLSVVLPVRAEQVLWMDPQLFDHEQKNNIILVTYAEKQANRIQIGAANQTYRRRGEYSNSTWSRKVASAIGVDYQLKILSQWFIGAISEYCVVYQINENQSATEIINKLLHDDRIDHVQGMTHFRVMADSYNDPYFRLQTHIQPMNLAAIHSQVTGKNVRIAIIDTGIDVSHPDLAGQIKETRNFVTQKSPEFNSDLHGTAIAGVIVAKADNEEGIVGIAPDSHVIALKACWEIKTGSMEAICNSFSLALALNTAIEMKADIVNLSLTGPYDPILSKLIEIAIQRGITIIASQPSQIDENNGFPAYQPGVIGVQSLGSKLIKTSLQNQQSTVLAPGKEILTTFPNGAYDFTSGNSLATAHVSGLAALLIQQNSATSQEIVKLLAKSNRPGFYKIFQKTATWPVSHDSGFIFQAKRQLSVTSLRTLDGMPYYTNLEHLSENRIT